MRASPLYAPLAYGCAGILVLSELVVLAFALSPDVSPAYRARYIDGTSDCWQFPVSGEYELGTTMYATLANMSPGLRELMRCGWLETEPSGTWSRGSEAELRFQLEGERQDLVLELVLAPFAAEFGLTQRVMVSAGEQELGRFTLHSQPVTRHRISVPATVPVSEDGKLDIQLNLPDAATPKSVGINNDPRRLAIRLVAVRLTEGHDAVPGGGMP